MSFLAGGLRIRPSLSHGSNIVTKRYFQFSSILKNSPNKLTTSFVQSSRFHTQTCVLLQKGSLPLLSMKSGSSGNKDTNPVSPTSPTQEEINYKQPTEKEEAAILERLKSRPIGDEERVSASLLAFAVHNNVLDAVLNDAINFLQVYRDDYDFQQALVDRDVNNVEEIILSLKEDLEITDATEAFLYDLLEEEMLNRVEVIFSHFVSQVQDYKNEQEIEIILANELNPQEKEKIIQEIILNITRKSLKNQYRTTGSIKPINFKVTTTVNPDLLGGYLVESEDWFEDHTLLSSWKSQEETIQLTAGKQIPPVRVEEIEEIVIESPQPHPELQRREQGLQRLQELKKVLELKPDALSKLKDVNYRKNLEESLAETLAWGGKGLSSLAEFVNYESHPASTKADLQARAKNTSQIVDKMYNFDKEELERLKETNYFNTLPPIQPIMNDLRRNYIQLEVSSSSDEKSKLRKNIDSMLNTIKSRVQNNKETDLLLYKYKINSWKYKLVADLAEDSYIYKATQKLVQECENKIVKTEYTLPEIPEVKYSFSNLKKMTPQELVNVPTQYLLKLSNKQKDKLPLDEVKKILAPYEEPPVDIAKIRKLEITKMDPVDVDVISLDVRTEIEHFVFKRNSLLHTNLTPNIEVFDKPLENLLKGEVQQPTNEEIANIPEKWTSFESQLEDDATTLEKNVPLFTQFVRIQLFEDLPKEKWPVVREVNNRIIALHTLDKEINQKVQEAGRSPLPYPTIY